MEKISKKQHYVPQFILKNFAIENKNSLWIYDKKLSKSFPASIIDSASENYFYELVEEDYEINTEKKLADLESDCAPIFQKIIDEETLISLTKSEHSMLCLFTSVQYLRTKRIRESIEQINKQIVKKIEGDGLNIKDFSNFKEISDAEIKDSSIIGMHLSSLEVANDIIDKEYALCISPQNNELIISDNPVTLYNHISRPGRGSLGTRVMGIEIYFPITPKLSLIFTCPHLIKDIRDKIVRAKLLKNLGKQTNIDFEVVSRLIDSYEYKIPIKLKPENVEFQNSLQVIHSSRFIYSNKNNFSMVTDMLKKNPELKSSLRIESN